MHIEKLEGKVEKIAKPQIPQPESNTGLMSSANQAIKAYTAKAQGARHSYGSGIPANHPALQEE
jgi:hypothetical protein